MKQIVLASGSARRKKILDLAGVPYLSITSDVEEGYDPRLSPEEIVISLAQRKAEKVFQQITDVQNTIVLGADTIVVLANEILNKPANATEAATMLNKLSGQVHKVITGVVLLCADKHFCFTETTLLTFRPLSREQIEDYINTCQPFDKAGGYAIQEKIGPIAVQEIKGSYYNVVGLPLIRTIQALEKMGYTAFAEN